MKLEIADDIVRGGIADGVARFLSSQNKLADQVAELVLAQLQLLTEEQVLAILQIPERTFRRKVNEERLLSKDTSMGEKHPRYLLSEVLEVVRNGLIKRAGLKKDETPRIYGLPSSKAA
jgi:hypothetical protein